MNTSKTAASPARPNRRDDPALASILKRWDTSGLRGLTGHPDRPGLDPPPGLVPRLDTVAAALVDASAGRVAVDPLDLLGERATHRASSRQGRTSCGGDTRLLRTADGWLALTLARDTDVELLPAWLCTTPVDLPSDYPLGPSEWNRIAGLVADRPGEALDVQAGILGLAVGLLADRTAPTAARPVGGLPVRATRLGDAPPGRPGAISVLDLSALWAGPLCGRLLGRAGAHVTKVESTARPDGARAGNPAFFAALNDHKTRRSVDLGDPRGVDELTEMLSDADVVIESSRPRALAQLGIDAWALAARGPRVWVSITGYGRTGPDDNRVAFGDDAAVAGGLVARDAAGDPVFCGDAIADPASGLVAATAALAALATGGRWLIDVALTGVAAYLGPTGTADADTREPHHDDSLPCSP